MSDSALEIRVIDWTLEQPLAEFFGALRRNGDERFFHPHPLTNEGAEIRAQYEGKDLYYVLLEGDKVLGYGMLRGWDEGHEVPSLGIAMHPTVRGTGLGKLFMHFLHAVARRRGAERLRLKVYPENTFAVRLYEGFGYAFRSDESGQLLGIVDL